MTTDLARRIAFDPRAPQDERADALSELQKGAVPTAMLSDEVMSQIFQFADLNKSISKNVVPFPGKNQGKPGMQSVTLDEVQITLQGDWYEKRSNLGFHAMRQMVEQTPVLNAVVMTRIRQVSRFCRPQESGEGLGFAIRHVDKEHQITKSEKESLTLLSRFMSNCGWEFNPRNRKRLKRDSFPQLMGKLVRDSLTMDSAPIETEFKRDKAKGIDGFYAVDGATIRLCTEDGYRGNDEIYALQVIDGQIRSAYTHDDLIYEPRNPLSDVLSAGYGMGEPELLIRVVTGFLNAMTYNIKGFDSNSIPKGMLHLTGEYSAEDLSAFKRYWNSMVRGVNNAWTLPVMVSKDQESKASFENFGIENSEMAFAKWMTFLTSIICAIYGMSPSEINFDSFTGGNTSSLAGSDTEAKLADSKDKGLRPLLSYFEGVFSDYVICDFSDNYVFRWTGLDEEDKDQRQERAKLILTVDEMRAQDGYDKMDNPLGDAPLNPSLIGPWMQLTQAQGPDIGNPDEHPQPGQGDDQDPQDEQGGEPVAGSDGDGGKGGAGGDNRQQQSAGGAGDEDNSKPKPFGKSWAFLKSDHKGNDNHDHLGRFTYAFGERHGLSNAVAPVVKVHWPHDFDGTNKEHLRAAAIDKLKKWPKDGIKNKDSGWSWVVGRDDWKKIAKWEGQSVAGLHAIGGIEDLVNGAIRAETHQDASGNPSVFAVHRFYCPAFIDGAVHRVKLTVKDYVLTDGKERKNLHALEAIEIESPGKRLLQGPQGALSAYPPAQVPGGDLTMAELLQNVKHDGDDRLFFSEIHKSFSAEIPDGDACCEHEQIPDGDGLLKAAQLGIGHGDELFFHHPEKGVMSGRVLSSGADGCMLESGEADKAERHPVLWEAVLGHKTRKERKYIAVEQGEDGLIAEDADTGRRVYLHGEIPSEEEAE